MTINIEYNHLPQLFDCPQCHVEYWRSQHWYHERECKLGPLTAEMVRKSRYMPVNHAIQIGGVRLVGTTNVSEVVAPIVKKMVVPADVVVPEMVVPKQRATKNGSSHGKYKDPEKRKAYMKEYKARKKSTNA